MQVAPDFDFAGVKQALAAAAVQGVFLGTSSWKYPGWFGTVYEEQNYVRRGKVSAGRFERYCLEEYARLFPTVCVDAAYYRFPEADHLLALAAQVPPDFRFSLKATADITVRRFPALPRYGVRAGTLNPHFLNAELFHSAFLQPCAAIREFMGMILFEFSPFHAGDFARGRDFMAALDLFLAALPAGWNYGVEIRNRAFLHPDYFAMLAAHGVTHVFNSWAEMPGVAEQWVMPGSITQPDCVAARFLLKPGRKYQEAVDAFQPYDRLQEVQLEVRETAAAMVRRGAAGARSGRVAPCGPINGRRSCTSKTYQRRVPPSGGGSGA
jgi:uncharacterized protein YecE (DUF72 family)